MNENLKEDEELFRKKIKRCRKVCIKGGSAVKSQEDCLQQWMKFVKDESILKNLLEVLVRGT